MAWKLNDEVPSARVGPFTAPPVGWKPVAGVARVHPGRPIAQAKPFVKWVGGKTQLLSELAPRTWLGGVYYEPFLGGGALFLDRLPTWAALSDSNERLVRSYKAVRDEPDRVIDLLKTYSNDADFFEVMRQRSTVTDLKEDVEVAAWFIFLNRTAFNGLYRVNRQNIFNTPFGRYKNPKICDEVNLRACSAALRGTALYCASLEEALLRPTEGDFVYCDPPYAPISEAPSFTGYTSKGFGPKDQLRLRDLALELKERGVRVLISNSSAPSVWTLYGGGGFRIHEVAASRRIAADPARRGEVTELLIANYDIRARF